MSGRWYKRCGADFIHGTMMLTLEEKGAYSLCLDLIYDRGGPIPDNEKWLAGVCGISTRKWAAIRARLLDFGKLVAVNGVLSNARAALEIVSTETHARNQAESGAKGGRKRAENEVGSRNNSDLGQATLKPKEEIREEEIRLPAIADSAGEGDASDLWTMAQKCMEAGGVNSGQPQRAVEAIELIKVWIVAGGDLETDILPAIRDGVAHGPTAIGSLKFYDQRVLTSIAKRRSGVKIAAPPPPPAEIVFEKSDEIAEVTGFRRALAEDLSEATYRNWIDRARIDRTDAGFGIRAGSAARAEQLRNKYGVQVGNVAKRMLGTTAAAEISA